MKDLITLISIDLNMVLIRDVEYETAEAIQEMQASIYKNSILWYVINKNAKKVIESRDEFASRIGHKWEVISGLMKESGMKHIVYNGSVYMEQSSKNKWIIFADNSALYIRSNLGGKVVVSASIPNIYNEAEAAGILYHAQESTAYSIIKKVVNKVEQIRLTGILDNLEEDDA